MFEEYSTTGMAGGVINNLVKANEAVVKEIDDDPELSKKYAEDMAKLTEVRTNVEELIGLLFDKMVTPIANDTQETRYLDIAHSRAMPYPLLRRAGETEVPRMIKQLRRLQLTEFAETATTKRYGKEMGFCLLWKNPDYKPTKDEDEQRKQFEVRLQQYFFFAPADPNPSLSKFLGTMYEDFFDLDDITIKVERDALFRPIGLHIQDPSLWLPTISKVKQYTRFDADMIEDVDGKTDNEVEIPEAQYLLMQRGVKRAAVTRDILIKSHFFTRSDMLRWRRGFSIMEQAVNVTTIILNAITFNAANFNANRMPPGLLALTGGFTNQLMLEKLKKVLWASMTGAAQGRRFPLVGLPKEGDAKWVSMHNNAKEMEFYTGLTLFMSVVFALSGTDPNESGLASFHDSMKGKSLSEDSKDGVWKKSKDNGLKTALNHFEATLNTPMTDGKNVFEQATGLALKGGFKGLADEDMKIKTEINTKRIAIDSSINDIKKENGEEPAEYMIETPNGQINIYDIAGIGNATIAAFIRQDVQAVQQEKQLEQQNALTAQPGQEEGEGEYTDRDQELISKYGKPVEEE